MAQRSWHKDKDKSRYEEVSGPETVAPGIEELWAAYVIELDLDDKTGYELYYTQPS